MGMVGRGPRILSDCTAGARVPSKIWNVEHSLRLALKKQKRRSPKKKAFLTVLAFACSWKRTHYSMLASAAFAVASRVRHARARAIPIVGAARTFWADVPMAPKVCFVSHAVVELRREIFTFLTPCLKSLTP
jgi:hypothetical protein